MDWSDLPPELLHLISNKFYNTSDLIHFRGVCKTWRASAPVSELPSQIPYFLEKTNPGTTTLHLYSLSSGKTHKIDTPQCGDQNIVGSSNGHLLMHHPTSRNLSLLNPVTDSMVSLPFVRIRRPVLVWTNPDPIRTDNYAVCIFGNFVKKLSAFWRPGEMKWTTINGGSPTSCFYQGKYLSLHLTTKTLTIYDVATQTLRYIVPPPSGDPYGASAYLIISAGQVLWVLKHDDKYLPVHRCHFDIHRLDFGTGKQQPFWVKISNIGNQVLFLNSLTGFAINGSSCEGFRGNLIYFLKEEGTGVDYHSRYVLSRYDIEVGKAEVLPFPSVKGGTWFLPSLRCA